MPLAGESPLDVIRGAIATQINARIPELRTAGYAPGQVNPPFAFVTLVPGSEIDFVTFDHAVDYHLRITVLVAYADDPESQETLDGYLSVSGPTSIHGALDYDPTLGGVADFAVLTGIQNYGVQPWAGQTYLGAHLIVQVGAR